MQVPWKTDCLSEYLDMVKSGNKPDFSNRCLICDAKNCATFNGYYTRSVLDPLNNIFINDFPVLQYLCHRKGSNPVSVHITFSLLPWMLIPYHRLPLLFIIYAIKLKIQCTPKSKDLGLQFINFKSTALPIHCISPFITIPNGSLINNCFD